MAAVNNHALTVNNEKFSFHQLTIKQMWHVVSKGIIKANHEHLKPLLNLPITEDTSVFSETVGIFLRFSSWIPAFSEKIHPLRLPPQAIETFEELKMYVTKSAIVVADPSVPLVA